MWEKCLSYQTWNLCVKEKTVSVIAALVYLSLDLVWIEKENSEKLSMPLENQCILPVCMQERESSRLNQHFVAISQ